jgi:hypothetical protein
MKALARRIVRLEAVSQAVEDALVRPEALRKMAAIIEADCARAREKLLGDGPHEPAPRQPGIESEAMRILRAKLLREDAPLTVEPART